jgi:hypothetical protein
MMQRSVNYLYDRLMIDILEKIVCYGKNPEREAPKGRMLALL